MNLTRYHALLTRLEWVGADLYREHGWCSECGGREPRHADGCELAAVLREAEAALAMPIRCAACGWTGEQVRSTERAAGWQMSGVCCWTRAREGEPVPVDALWWRDVNVP